MNAAKDLATILTRHGQTVTLATGPAAISIRAVVGTARTERSPAPGGYSNESSQTVTVIDADLNIRIDPHATTCRVGQTLWRVVSISRSQAATGVATLTLGPINP